MDQMTQFARGSAFWGLRLGLYQITIPGQNSTERPCNEFEYQISSQTNKLQFFSTVKERQKIPAKHLDKIGVVESTGDVHYVAGRLIAAKTTSGIFQQCCPVTK
jgi:hypothetical protein